MMVPRGALHAIDQSSQGSPVDACCRRVSVIERWCVAADARIIS